MATKGKRSLEASVFRFLSCSAMMEKAVRESSVKGIAFSYNSFRLKWAFIRASGLPVRLLPIRLLEKKLHLVRLEWVTSESPLGSAIVEI